MDGVILYSSFILSTHSYIVTPSFFIHLGSRTGAITGLTHTVNIYFVNTLCEYRFIILISVKLGVVWAVRTIHSVHTS